MKDEKLLPFLPCIHRGEPTRQIDCKACGGGGSRLIYECDAIPAGECTLARCTRKMQPCHSCRRREVANN